MEETSVKKTITHFAWLSIAAALSTIGLKTIAYYLTGSVGLLSDALESIVNLIAAVMALWMLKVAASPADDDHAHGHTKAEYFASIVEGLLILIAAVGIAYAAIKKLIHPTPLDKIGIGLFVSTGATLINFGVAKVLNSAGKKYSSIVLEADAKHLMTDVWTSVGIILSIILIYFTGWTILDPIIALIVDVYIVLTGFSLISRSVDGLMDKSFPTEELAAINEVMNRYRTQNIDFHALRTRTAASRRFLTVHMLVPGSWSVYDAHHMAEEFEGEIRKILPDTLITTHIEPLEDVISFIDVHEK